MLTKRSSRLTATVVGVIVLAVAVVGVLLTRDSAGADSQQVALQPGLISPAEYQRGFDAPGEDHFLLDVRTPEEFAEGHIAGAVNIPVQVLDQYLSMVPTDQDVVLYCRTGNRSVAAMQILHEVGYDRVFDIDGGIVNWTRQNLPLE